MRTARFFLLAILLCASLVPVAPALAQVPCTTGTSGGTFCPLADVRGSKIEKLYATEGSLSGFVSGIFSIAISAGAIFAVLRLSWAGYLYMTSDSWGSKGHAREVIGDVVLGLLLLLGSWLILHQINPDILKVNFLAELSKLKPVETRGAGINNL